MPRTENTRQSHEALGGKPLIVSSRHVLSAANEAYFQGDGKSFEGILSDKLVMQRGGSRLGKADVVKMISGVKCDVKGGWSMTEPQISKIDNDNCALSYVTTVEGSRTGDGKTDRLPSPVRVTATSRRTRY